MDGLTIGLTIGGIIIGAIVTFVVSKHFFNKSEKAKSLTPYLQFRSRLFSELDPELKKELIVNYKNHKIDNISQAQFLIANDGDLPIRDIIEPLKLKIPKENQIFSASIIHIEPEGRKIEHKIIESENSIIFDIPLLNAGEYFVVKLLLQDKLIEDKEESQKIDYSFSITADDLEPNLQISSLPYSYYEEDKKKKHDFSGFWIALVFGVLLTSIVGVLYSFKSVGSGLYIFSFSEFFSKANFGFYSICIILMALIGLLFLIVTIIGIIAGIIELYPDEKPKFRVPNKLKKDKLSRYPIDFFE